MFIISYTHLLEKLVIDNASSRNNLGYGFSGDSGCRHRFPNGLGESQDFTTWPSLVLQSTPPHTNSSESTHHCQVSLKKNMKNIACCWYVRKLRWSSKCYFFCCRRKLTIDKCCCITSSLWCIVDWHLGSQRMGCMLR